MFNLTGTAADYLTPPARRPDWDDTWTMQRTRRHAMTSLSAAYAAARRTLAGALATVLLLGGAYLIGWGSAGIGGAEQLAATVILSAGVLLVLLGLGLSGYVLFTGVRVVSALRAWSKVRNLDGGPGVRAILTLGLLLRVVLGVLILAAGVAMVLVRLDVLRPEFLTSLHGSGQALWQWAAAITGIVAGLTALAGFVLSAVALRRPRPQKAAAETGGHDQGMAGGADEALQETAVGGIAAPTPAGAAPSAPAGAAAAGGGTGAGAPGWPQPGRTGQEQPATNPWQNPTQPAQYSAQPASASPAVDDVADTRLASQVPRPTTAGIAAVLPDGQQVTTPGITLLGRAPAAGSNETVGATAAINDVSVSKTHLSLRIEGEAIWATDRASTNGTDLFRSGERYSLVAWEEAPLQPGDELVLGRATVRIDRV